MLILEMLSLFGVMILQVVIPPIPAELIVIGAGNRYGVVWTSLVSGSGLWAGSLLVYFLGVRIREWFSRFFSRDKVARVMDRLLHHQNLILWIRVLPYNPSDVISYAAGILRISPKKFVLVTCATSYLRCLMLTLLGQRIRSLKEVFIVLGLLVVSAIAANAVVAGRRMKDKSVAKERDEAGG